MTLVGVLASGFLVMVMKPLYNEGEFTLILELVMMVAKVFADPVCLVEFLIIDAYARFRCDEPPSVTTEYACDGNRCDVVGNDVIRLDVIGDDVMSDVIGSGITSDDITVDVVLDWNALGDDVIRLDVIGDDVVSDVIGNGVTNDDTTVDVVLDWNALGDDVSDDIIDI